jgi:TRAP transporter TAXI family solute receptor
MLAVAMFLFSLVLFEGRAEARRFMTFGAPPASSNYYPYWVAVAQVIHAAIPEFQISVAESQGAVHIIRKLRAGIIQIGNAQSTSDYESFFGQAIFEGDPFKEARILWYFDESPIQFIVAREHGIRSVQDLEGRRFNPGGTGTAVAVTARQIFDVLGVNPDFFEAGQASAAEAIVNRHIIGTVKTGNIDGPDSFVLQLKASLPIDLISFTEEEIEAITTAFPYLLPHVMLEGMYEGVGDVRTVKIAMGSTATSSLSQEDGYRIFSAIMAPEGRAVLDAAFPNGAGQDIIDLTLRSRIPLHAGTVQFLKEHNVTVPVGLIPPEFTN